MFASWQAWIRQVISSHSTTSVNQGAPPCVMKRMMLGAFVWLCPSLLLCLRLDARCFLCSEWQCCDAPWAVGWVARHGLRACSNRVPVPATHADNGVVMLLAVTTDAMCRFKSLATAFQVMGFSPSNVDQVWQVLGGLLNLGNVVFEASTHTGGGEGSSVRASSAEHLATSATRLGVSTEDLQRVLTSKT